MLENNLNVENLSKFIANKRWFGIKSENFDLLIEKATSLCKTNEFKLFLFIVRTKSKHFDERYFLPLILTTKKIPYSWFTGSAYICEAEYHPTYYEFLRRSQSPVLYMVFKKVSIPSKIRPLGGTTNLNLVLDDKYVFKSYKKLSEFNPEPKILMYLSRMGFEFIPRLMDVIKLSVNKKEYIVGIISEYLQEAITASKLFLRIITNPLAGWHDKLQISEKYAEKIGEITALFHKLIARSDELGAEKVSQRDRALWLNHIREKLNLFKNIFPSAKTELLLSKIENSINKAKIKMRIHMDYHLEQLLFLKSSEKFFIIDFEGEPQRISEERIMKYPPVRDIATMLRSFGYVKHFAYIQLGHKSMSELDRWENNMCNAFLRGYNKHLSFDVAEIEGWYLEKAFMEALYEYQYRKEYLYIPLEPLKKHGIL